MQGLISASGSVKIQFSVRPVTFAELARVQAWYIRQLENAAKPEPLESHPLISVPRAIVKDSEGGSVPKRLSQSCPASHQDSVGNTDDFLAAYLEGRASRASSQARSALETPTDIVSLFGEDGDSGEAVDEVVASMSDLSSTAKITPKTLAQLQSTFPVQESSPDLGRASVDELPMMSSRAWWSPSKASRGPSDSDTALPTASSLSCHDLEDDQ